MELLEAGTAEETDRLLKAGADPNYQNIYGETALMRANSAEQTDLLLKAGSDICLQDRDGNKAIHDVKNVEMLRLLIEYGADPEAKNKAGKTILDIAREENLDELVKFLITEVGVDEDA